MVVSCPEQYTLYFLKITVLLVPFVDCSHYEYLSSLPRMDFQNIYPPHVKIQFILLPPPPPIVRCDAKWQYHLKVVLDVEMSCIQ